MVRRLDQGQPIQTVHFKFPPFLNPQQERGNIFNKMRTNLAGGMRKTTAIPTQENKKTSSIT